MNCYVLSGSFNGNVSELVRAKVSFKWWNNEEGIFGPFLYPWWTCYVWWVWWYTLSCVRTGAIVTLSSRVSLIYFYCSWLPYDEYPAWNFVNYNLYYILPYTLWTSGALPFLDISNHILVVPLRRPWGPVLYNFQKVAQYNQQPLRGNKEILKQLACLEAFKQLHDGKAKC